MSALLARLRRIRTSESGVSLIEVIVAMMVFAIISVGVAYALLSAFTMTGDSRSRAVATNLAAQEIDLDRSSGDLFSLQNTPADKQIQVPAGTGVVYLIKRTASWVYASGGDVDCNAAAASSILYKRVRVQISWPKMIGQPVVSDTVLAPSTKISVDTLGTILVSTKSAAGTPVSGIGVTVSPNPGSVPTATDAMGCSYVLKVPPTSYTVTVSQTNYVDPYQNAAPSKTVTVKAGQSTSAGFTYDAAGKVGWSWPSSGGITAPTTSTVSFLSTYGVWSTAATSPTSAQLFPSTVYNVVAGAYVPATESNTGCRSPNPGDWPQYTSAGKTYLAPAAPSTTVAAGAIIPGITIGTLPMKTITVTNALGGQSAKLYLRAVSAASTVSGDPGCTGKPQTIDFGQVLGKSKNNNVTIALPYGAWTLSSGTTATPTTAVPSTWLSVPTGQTGVTIASSGAFTLDPRVVQP